MAGSPTLQAPLTQPLSQVKGALMTRNLFLVALGATSLLAACDNSDHTIVAGPDIDEQPVSTENVVLPPSIQASKTYRCSDNSVVYVDWMSDGTSRVKTEANAVGTPPEEGALTGDAAASTITYQGKSCKA